MINIAIIMQKCVYLAILQFMLCHRYNCPELAGTVPELAPLSLVPKGNYYSPQISRIFRVAAPELGYYTPIKFSKLENLNRNKEMILRW